jgi:hypothetical protein
MEVAEMGEEELEEDQPWLPEGIERDVQRILELVKGLPERFQERSFGILLSHLLNARATRSTTKSSMRYGAGFPRYQNFITQHRIDEGDLALLLDFESGAVLVRDLGKQKADKQRKLAALVALRHCAITGDFDIPKEELIENCRTFDAYDSANFVRNMRTATFDGSRIFLENDGDWKLSAPGESFLADIVDDLTGKVGQP